MLVQMKPELQVIACHDLIILLSNLCRKRSAHKDTDSNKNIAVSANMAYGEVTLKPAVMMTMEGEYENPDKILKPSGQWSEETVASNYETIDTSKQPAMELPC